MISHPRHWIDAEKKAEAKPPKILFPFIKWCLQGSFPVLFLASFASIASGVIETFTAAIIGFVVDYLVETNPQNLFEEKGLMLLALMAFLFFIRPIFFSEFTAFAELYVTALKAFSIDNPQ